MCVGVHVWVCVRMCDETCMRPLRAGSAYDEAEASVRSKTARVRKREGRGRDRVGWGLSLARSL